MEFWDLFVAVVVGGGGGAVLAYIAQTPREKKLSLFGIRPFGLYLEGKLDHAKKTPGAVSHGVARV